MGEQIDFERAWQTKLGRALEAAVGRVESDRIMAGGDVLSDESERAFVIAWTQEIVRRCEDMLDERELADVFTACSCRYPPGELESLRAAFEARRDLDEILEALHERFIHFLNTLGLPQASIEDVVSRGWGLAGRREGDTLYATKIPKSGYLQAYLDEPDPDRRREMYCHCPRVRDAVSAGETLPASYCYCGAGYYKDIWERITNRPVRVQVVSSVLAGDDTCTIAIHLDPGASTQPEEHT